MTILKTAVPTDTAEEVVETRQSMRIWYYNTKGWQKKTQVHPKFDLTSKCNNSETISQNHLKFNVSRLTIVDYSLINFQVNRTFPSRVIAVGSWVRFCVDSFFYDHPL